MSKLEPTKYALALALALENRNIEFSLEHWDGHKHVDICIPAAKINIEIDGLQHYENPRQIIADFNRESYSDKDGFYTLHIPNEIVRNHLAEIALAIEKVVQAR